MKAAIAFGAIGLGFTLLVLSSVWTSLFPGTSSWTPEKSARSAEIKARLSNLGPLVTNPSRSMHAGQDAGTLKAEFDALMKEDAQLNAEFESARDAPKTATKILKWSGIGLAVVGLLGYYAVKQTS
jgi:hypothetical protein